MTFKELADQASQSAVGWGVAGLLAGVAWVIRRVFTNHKQIELMQQDQVNRADERRRDREEYKADLSEIKKSQHEMADDIRKLFRGAK